MSTKLRPLKLPQLVEDRKMEERRRREREEEEAAQREGDVDVPYNFYTTDSYSSDATSPVTPTFSTRGHLRYSSSMSSFDLATVASSDSPSSPTQTAQSSSKRVLPDVKEEPIEYEDSDSDYDDISELYHCLCDEPCIHRDTDLVQSTSNFYTQSRSTDYDAGFFSDGDFSFSLRSSRKRRDGAESPFAGLSQRIGSRFPSFTKWKSSKPSSIISSPTSDYGFDQRPILSRATSSRSSSLSAPSRHHPDRSNEPPVPPTPALSRLGSNDSFVPLDGAIDLDEANGVLGSIERDRKQAVTPLLPPMMASTSTEYIPAQSSPLESPSVASPKSPFGDEARSTGMMSPPLSARPSTSSLRLVPVPMELPQLPAPDAWSDRLGHANYTIVPKPYKPEAADLESLRQFRADWETARVNYTKHLARTGEHYGQTSKTYALTEAKWAETQRTWRNLHDEIAEAVVASGETTVCEKFDEGVCIWTTVPRMDAEGKFPERGDEDIVGPMVREATMSSLDSIDRKGSGFWRHLAGKVGLKK
ncbi:hypothetical protein F4821DRAFT_262144 [Hypoxylon rubiginosum]|uniref:Uncharacterized protein n=1 Tax=Hypoxylon rubiginosum TaxID=110542 RepID=A0ACC0CUP8_9PEZI|nr:hypothetical protein F4821DRAFT_262144 [Hypoxylon rubiginosum]